jgi:hypothetical protein
MMMKVECPIATRTHGSMSYVADRTDLPPSQAGLAVALRCAFEMPGAESARKLEELLRRLG